VIIVGLIPGFRPAGGVIGVVAAVALVLLFPLTFISNIFVDARTMPAWIQTSGTGADRDADVLPRALGGPQVCTEKSVHK
jgi:hypothetical protein